MADGWNAAYVGAAEFRELSAVLDDWCGTAGRPVEAVEGSINLMFSLSPDDARSAQAVIEEQWGDRAGRVRAGSLLGRPDDVIEQLTILCASPV